MVNFYSVKFILSGTVKNINNFIETEDDGFGIATELFSYSNCLHGKPPAGYIGDAYYYVEKYPGQVIVTGSAPMKHLTSNYFKKETEVEGYCRYCSKEYDLKVTLSYWDIPIGDIFKTICYENGKRTIIESGRIYPSTNGDGVVFKDSRFDKFLIENSMHYFDAEHIQKQ